MSNGLMCSNSVAVLRWGRGHRPSQMLARPPKYLGNLFIKTEKKIKLNGPKSGITTAISLASYHKKAGLRLCRAVSQWRHIERNHLWIVNLWHVPSTRICEWLPQIAHINIFVFAHKNANEPATSQRICGRLHWYFLICALQMPVLLLLSSKLWQNSGSSLVKCYDWFNTALME